MSTDLVRFSFPTSIVFGPGTLEKLPDLLEEVSISKPLLVTDPGLQDGPVFSRVQSTLQDANRSFAVFSEVRPNPYDQDLEAAVSVYQAEACDGVIGLGGGSALDTAKILPVALRHGPPLSRFNVQNDGGVLITGALSPMLAIPTTAGTGSEVGSCSVITLAREQRKILICNRLMLPKLALLDPELTLGLPAWLTAATGMDAFVHNLESLTSPAFHPMCDGIAEKGLEFVVSYLERAVTRPDDLEARGHMMLAAMMGAVAFQKDLGASHSLSHALSAVCDLQHGLANAICLPEVMRFNRQHAAKQYARLARIFGINTFGLLEIEAADKAIEAVAALNERINIPKGLAEVGVRGEQLPELAQKAAQDVCHQTNARPCSEENLLQMLSNCL